MKMDVDDGESNDVSTGERMVLISKSGGRHPVDRNMLLRTSEYFQRLANSGMRDAYYRELTLECLTNESLIEVRDYLIKGNKGLSIKSLNEVEAGLDGAFYLQMKDMIDCYIEMLLKHLDESTCIRIVDIANKYLLIDQVVKKIIAYILKNFKEISDSLKLSLAPDEMFRLVASEEINADSEMDIFNLIIRWLSEDQKRKCVAEKLLTEVRYSLMTTAEKQICTAILNDLNLNICYNKDKDSNITRAVGKIFAIGSTETRDGTFLNILPVYNFVEACKTSCYGAWQKHVNFNPSSRNGPPGDWLDYNACVLDNCLYLVGGKRSVTCNVFMYNPVTGVWSECRSMHFPRRQFYLGNLAGHLYAVSGYTKYIKGTPTVEKYIPSENQWHMVQPLPLALPYLAGCVYNGMIYVSALHFFYRYDSSSNKWLSRASMLTARTHHSMTSTGDKIFAFGGTYRSIDQSYNALDGEMYDVEGDQWTYVFKLEHPAFDSPSITINNCLYIFQQESKFPNNVYRVIQKIFLTKYLKGKETPKDSSLSSAQEAVKRNSPGNEDCQVYRYSKRHKGILTPFNCLHIGVMVIPDS